MERPLLKLYLVISLALALTIVLVPGIVTRTSGWMTQAVTRAKLIAYQCYADPSIKMDGQNKGKAIIIMDDGWETQFTGGYRILEQYGFRGCIAVVPAAVGTPEYLNYEQLAQLYTHGWDLLNHTYNHANLSKLSEAGQIEQVNRARDWLKKHGLDRGSNIVVYPQGEHTQALVRTLEAEGYIAARSLRSLWSAPAGGTLEDVEICTVLSTMPFTRVKEAIDKAIRNKSAVILMLHKIEPVTDDSQMQVEEQYLQNIAGYLSNNKEQINVMTLTEYLSLQTE